MMPEILTESFCERCGTRYTFESAAPRKTRRIGKFKTLSKGMKNWVLSDDTSLDEAMAAARNDEERELTSHQLDAFHSTFNFCMTCRQYTCGNCWNAAEGRCLTCAPNLGHEILPAQFPDQAPSEPIRIVADSWPEVDLTATGPAANGNGHDETGVADAVDPWAAAGATDLDDLPEFDAAARLAFLSGETPAAQVASEPDEPAAEQAVAEEVLAEPEEAPVAEAIAAIDETPTAQAVAEPEEATVAQAVAPIDETPVAEAVAEPEKAPAAQVIAAPDTTPSWLRAIAVTPAPRSGAAETAAAEVAEVAEPVMDAVEAEATVAEPAEIAAEAAAAEAVSVEPALDAAPADAQDEVAAEAAPEIAAPPAAIESPPASIEGRAVTGSARTSDLLQRFRPGQNIDAELAAYEAEVDGDSPAAAPEPEPEPIAAAPEPVAVEPEPIAAAREPVAAAAEPVAAAREPVAAAAEPVVAAREPEPEPIAAASEPEPVAAAPEPEPVAAAPEPEPDRKDRIEQPTWQIFAPDQAPAASPSSGQPGPISLPTPPPPGASPEPQWPARPEITDSPAMALLSNRGNRSPSDGLWAASAQEVLSAPVGTPVAGAPAGVQPCANCGLSLSATARFCRRCGSRQG
jgi:hypothetical protein